MGEEDFGLYNLIAGIIVLLSFINGALMISSQRYFSISIGERNHSQLEKYFNASLGVHILLGIFLFIFLLSIKNILFESVLNISTEKITIGKAVYDIMITSAFVTISTIPFSAIMNAKEDMVYHAFCDIVACILRLIAAIVLLFIDKNLLLIYTLLILCSLVLKFLMEALWDINRYKEIKIKTPLLFNRLLYKEMLGFIGWNTLGSFAVVVRNQGVAVILNSFFGTIINAAYGIANQVNALILSFASTLTTVFTPMIIQAKGEGNEKKMISTAIFSSKMSFFLSSLMALPILIYLDDILSLWLGDYPDHTKNFCFYIILSFLSMQVYPGINRAIYATGKIKNYQIWISLLLVSILPVGIILFKLGLYSDSIMIVMLISQLLTIIPTIYYARKYANLDAKRFVKDSVMKPFAIFIISLSTSFFVQNEYYLKEYIILKFTAVLIIFLLYSYIYYICVFSEEEQNILKTIKNKSKLKKS